LGIGFRKIADRYRKLFFVNDRADLALAVRADGLHLGQDDLPIKAARKIVGKRLFIGRSTHSRRQALKAQREGFDYIGVGPVFFTPTKPNTHPVGLKLVRFASKKIKLPFVAIGGIDLTNVGKVRKSGAKAVAVVRAVVTAKDPKKACKEMLRKITNDDTPH
jgi:thiamine-phosphate pyrophosphorylase